MRSPNRLVAGIAALFLLVAGLVPATAAPPCGPEPTCAPCGRLPAHAAIASASCCCCDDLAAAESAVPEVAESPGMDDSAGHGLRTATSPAQAKVAQTEGDSTLLNRTSHAPHSRPPFFQLYQSLLI